MVKVVCGVSGIEFEAATKRSKQHPLIAKFKENAYKNDLYREAERCLTEVRSAGGYTTIEEYMRLVDTQMDTIKAAKAKREAQWNADQREREAATERAKEEHRAQNALLKAHGYEWSKDEITGYFAGVGDTPEYVWVLTDPDGAEIAISQALDEIKRGRDVVRAEIAARKAAAAKKADAEAAKETEFRKNEDEFDAKVAEIERTCEALPRIGFDWSITRDWPVIAKIEGATSSYRAFDEIRQGAIDGVTHYRVVTGSGYDDDGLSTVYRQIGDTQLWASGD